MLVPFWFIMRVFVTVRILLDVTYRITEYQYSESLNNKSSAEFQELATQFSAYVRTEFFEATVYWALIWGYLINVLSLGTLKDWRAGTFDQIFLGFDLHATLVEPNFSFFNGFELEFTKTLYGSTDIRGAPKATHTIHLLVKLNMGNQRSIVRFYSSELWSDAGCTLWPKFPKKATVATTCVQTGSQMNLSSGG